MEHVSVLMVPVLKITGWGSRGVSLTSDDLLDTVLAYSMCSQTFFDLLG